MSPSEAVDLTRDALIVVFVVCAPVIVTVLFVGFLISLLQALTQVQEMTLSFVPKMLAAISVLLIGASFMGGALGSFAERSFKLIEKTEYRAH
jgi:flagellar biosynthetic protein FliQ